jgi:hypothetical protein
LNANRRALAASAGTALGLCLLAYGLEAAAIHVFHPTDRALARGSVVVLAVASGVAVYLWRRLLTAKRKMAERERAEIVLDTQLSVAAEIQRRLLPSVPPAANGFEWAAELRSAGKIGGDFYDFVEFSPTVWVMLVADVSGKGIPAAMALGSLRLAFRSFARQDCDPARIVTRLAAVLYEEWYGSPFVTCIVGTFDLAKRTLTYSNAGHPPGILGGQRAIRYLNQGGPPAGLLPGAAFDREVIQLHSGMCAFWSLMASRKRWKRTHRSSGISRRHAGLARRGPRHSSASS